jgi:hypothetical protein
MFMPFNSIMTGTTIGAETVFSSGVQEFTPIASFCWICVAQYLVFFIPLVIL